MNAGVHSIFHPFLNLGHQSAVFPTAIRGLTTSNATAAGGADVTEVLGGFRVFFFCEYMSFSGKKKIEKYLLAAGIQTLKQDDMGRNWYSV